MKLRQPSLVRNGANSDRKVFIFLGDEENGFLLCVSSYVKRFFCVIRKYKFSVSKNALRVFLMYAAALVLDDTGRAILFMAKY